MSEQLISTAAQAVRREDLNSEILTSDQQDKLKVYFGRFLDTVGSATNRATHYNTKEEQQKAVLKVHSDMFKLERSVYGLTTCLPGATDFSRQMALTNLLKNPRKKDTYLTEDQEYMMITWLTNNIAPHRMLNIFGLLKHLKVNNSRTKRLILNSILGNKKLELWSVKYRNMLKDALGHAWGQKTRGMLIAIMRKKSDDRSDREMSILNKHVDKYVFSGLDVGPADGVQLEAAYECIRFVFRDKTLAPSLDLIQKYELAKTDFKLGAGLPQTTLVGIRTMHHSKTVTKTEEVKQVVKSGNLTVKEKKNIQRAAKTAKVEKHKNVKFEPRHYETVDLYKYAYEMGITDDIQAALGAKATKSANGLPVRFNKVGILVDTSLSMFGDETQKNHPISVALATRDMLIQSATESSVIYSGYEDDSDVPVLPSPQGDTVLAEGLVALLQESPDSVFILSDGYENCPAGRTAEVIRLARGIGVATPIYQLSPVMSAEAGGIRKLGDDIFSMPIRTPNGIGITLLKGMFEQDVLTGVSGLINTTMPLLEGGE